MSRKQWRLSTADLEVRLAQGSPHCALWATYHSNACLSTFCPPYSSLLKSLEISKLAPKWRLVASHQHQSAHRLETPHGTKKARKIPFFTKENKHKVDFLQIPTEGHTRAVAGSEQPRHEASILHLTSHSREGEDFHQQCCPSLLEPQALSSSSLCHR